ncbi:hypothetical protein GF373_17450, partial [bacterium]|nr:hypothetical protein [bacterium]
MIPEKPYSESLLEDSSFITVEKLYDNIISQSVRLSDDMRLSQTPGKAKSLPEVFKLLKQIIEDFESRQDISGRNKVFFTAEEVDLKQEIESVVYKVIKRAPGGMGTGRPFSQESRNFRPFLREEIEDEENPGYMKAIFGQWFDNEICLTCWSRTSWQAEQRAWWLEDIIDRYTWWLTMQGVSRIFFWGRTEDEIKDID